MQPPPPRDEKPWLAALCSLPGITSRVAREMLCLFGSPREAWEALLKGASFKGPSRETLEFWRETAQCVDPVEQLASITRSGCAAVARGESRYPAMLAETHDPPPILFCRGVPEAPLTRAVSIVGSRKATPYGLEVAVTLARELARSGVAIVSGAAYGIDAAAHRGALEAGGTTVAVMGCGPDVAYPRSNSGLLDEISRTGSVMSEYPPGTQPVKRHFPARNRIIAGVSLGVVVVEAGATSGALKTADFALQEGREVFAVPGQVLSPNSRGTNSLLKNGAVLVRDAGDVLGELGLGSVASATEVQPPLLSAAGERLLDSLRRGISDVVGLARSSGLEVHEAMSELLQLEVAGLARRGPGGRYHQRSTRK